MFSTTGMQPSPPCPRFEFPEILKATEDFSESLVIGNGGFGKVYKGYVINGSSLVVAAIKRFNCMSNQGATEFWAEVEMLSMLRHCNLVSLIGYCIYEEEMILLYEYMSNGTLDDHLHKFNNPLSWLRRLNICVGASRGLHYLHTGTGIESGVIHRDVKSSNILLHESWSAKISDFGLSKICPTNQPSTHVTTQIKGTFGYLDPNYYKTGMLTRKSDVYAFGVVMLEVLCRKRAVDRSINEEQWGLVQWAQNSIKKGNLKHIIDSDIRSQISPKCLKEFITLAAKCLHNGPKRRPTMAEVVVGLESILILQEKFNNSLQSAHKTVFGRMVNMFPFPYSNEENTVEIDSKLSNIKGNCGIARFTISTDNNGSPEMKEVTADSQSPSQSMKEFTFDDLRKATREFSPGLLLGEGDLKKVFLGWVDKKTFAASKHGDEIAVAIKNFHQENSQGYAEWLAEMYFLGQLAHPNIIRLLGYCRDEHERLLVYEYMPNKSFGHFLFTDGLVGKPLSWGTRLSIMIGVARGLTYLHSTEIIHCDLKPSNILLDEKFNVKLGGFGLATCGPEIWETHVSARIIRTHGYTAPEYHTTGHMSMKSDIYSFGVLLLESITGRRALNPNLPNEKQNLVDWATQVMSERRNAEEIMDPHLEHKYPVQGSFECVVLALRCVANKPYDRPSSKDVLLSLEQISSLNK